MQLNEILNTTLTNEISQLTIDSRLQAPQSLFFCLKGMIYDSHKFVDQAIANGAVAIVHSEPLASYHPNISYLQVEDTYKALNQAVGNFYHNCTQAMLMIGVTGTNGKTTVATWIQYLLNKTIATGYIGTNGIHYGKVYKDTKLTTPDAITLGSEIYTMYQQDIQAIAMEMSSHALELHRGDFIDFNIGIFTNLTHDHLDFHGTMENYLEAKKRLFDNLPSSGYAITNLDDAYGLTIVQDTPAHVITIAIDQPAIYQAINVELFSDTCRFTLLHNNETYPVVANTSARFNIYNLLAAIAACHLAGMNLDQLTTLVGQLCFVKGRMQCIKGGQKFLVMVDFAHTPDGFEQIFQHARQLVGENQRIIAVFGSAGNRDTKKRPILGAIADKFCDMIVLTEEDPRTESAYTIAKEIAQGIIKHPYIIVDDRYTAIAQGLELAVPGDIVLILGKGDDRYMERGIGKDSYQGDDVVALDLVKTIGK
jgi:UDP-N-acetylmuramoyl-L-alanyl-D-glutamate--2,6-diaminopimelate ligase